MSAEHVSRQVRAAIVELAKLRTTDGTAAEQISLSLSKQLQLMGFGPGPEFAAAIAAVEYPYITKEH